MSGIYAFMHKDTKKLYVGSTFNLARIMDEHLNNRNSNINLQRAFTKYGLIHFSLYILEVLNTFSEADLSAVVEKKNSLHVKLLENICSN